MEDNASKIILRLLLFSALVAVPVTLLAYESTGPVVIVSNPSGASIIVDNEDTGLKTPSRVNGLSPTSVILLRKDGWLDTKVSKLTRPITRIDLKRH